MKLAAETLASDESAGVELKVVADGVLIRPVQPRISLAERLASYTPMAGEATAPFHRIPAQASSTSASTAATSPSLR